MPTSRPKVFSSSEERGDEGGGEEAVGESRRRGPEVPDEDPEDHARQQLHAEIAPGDGLAAVGTPGAQQEEADQRDVQPGRDRLAAAGAVGGGMGEVLAAGEPPDNDVQEAPDNRSEQERKGDPERGRDARHEEALVEYWSIGVME
jgi:hypothetical protein